MRSTEYKLYAERDIMQLDKAGNYYCKHIMAMTAEGLHSKSDIAAELAYRDSVIAELEGQLANREPFVVRLPADWCFTQEDNDSYQAMVVGGQQMRELCKAAITAAGGRCV